MEQGEYAAKYWRVLFELNERKFAFAEFRALKKILNLSYRRGLPDVFVARLDDLAASIDTNKGNLQKILARLESRQILGRRGGHWWINDINLWQALASDAHTDPATARRAVEADARLLEDNPLAPTGQLGLWPAEITDAEVQAEANREHAANWPLPGLPPATSPDDLSNPGQGRCKKDNERAGTEPFVVKKTTNAQVNTTGVVKKTTGASIVSRDRARVRPGYQEINPGNQDQGGTGGRFVPLGESGYSLFDELMEWCSEQGPAATEKQVNQWRWRIARDPRLVERCLRETQAVVKEGRQMVHNRGGFVKMLWRQWSPDSDEMPGPAPAAAAAPAQPPLAKPGPQPVSRERQAEMAAAAAQESAALRAKLAGGKSKQ